MAWTNNVLLIVEGSKDEKNIFDSIFRHYGFKTILEDKKLVVENIGEFVQTDYSSSDSTIVIVEGPRNRIHGFLKYYDEHSMDIERFFNFSIGFFNSIFLIYDVDHNDCEDVSEMYNRFKDESSGMLLLSSPCIEVVGDFDNLRNECRYSHLTEYKKEINVHYQGGLKDHIINHFEERMLYFLEKNYKDFNEPNIMEHPRLIIEPINKYNERHNLKPEELSYVIYRYFSTVIYVAIAHANRLTIEVENYEKVKSFFKSKL